MSTGETRRKLIQLIAKHQINFSGKKLTLSDASEQVGISRQSFNRFYKDLKPYLAGKSIQGLLEKIDSSANNDLLLHSQKRNAELEAAVAKLELKHAEDLKELDDTYITSLMNDDIALFDASEVRQNMTKHSLHLDELLRKIDKLESELTKERMKQLSASGSANVKPNFAGKTVNIEPNLHQLFDRFHEYKDMERFDKEKDEEISVLTAKVNKLLKTAECKIILFIDRFFSSFEKFTRDYPCVGTATHIFIRLPVFSIMERKLFIETLEKNAGVSIYFPFCESDAVQRAQRTFLFRDIPPIEAEGADKAQAPTIKEGYSNICLGIVRQGD